MRFLAITRDARIIDPEIHGLMPLYCDDRIAIFGDDATSVTTFSDMLVIGTSFPTAAPVTPSDVSPFGRLSTERWGSYASIRFDVSNSHINVFADPSGLVPCYYCARGRSTAVGSDAALVLQAVGEPIRIDWDELTLQLLRRDWRNTSSSIARIREVAAGTAVTISDPHAEPEAIWSPALHLRRSSLLSFAQASREVLAAIKLSVTATAARCQRLLVGVSGGLDSSIVAAALRESGADFECFTMYHAGSDGDERRHARALCEHLGVHLTECPYLMEDIDLERSSVANLPRPIGWPFQQALDRASERLVDEIGADGIVRGTGGDSVFCYNNSASPIADAFLESGLMEALRTCHDLSVLTGATFWQGIQAARKTMADGGRPLIRIDQDLLSKSAVAHPGRLSRHPWVSGCAGMPPGRQRQVDMICALHNILEARLALRTDVLCPLLAQPVIEKTLATPAREWIRGGDNRAVVRTAFADLLPASILQRRSKGGPMAFAASLYMRNRLRIRQLLMDGQLASRGIVDRGRIEIATRNQRANAPDEMLRLLELVDTEAWIAHWMALGDRSSSIAEGAPA